ncbi:SNF2-related protein [Chryseobacterium sp. Ch-15]|uniref:SNF2-related protein n=2 Tax=Chryseobacterium muglaense TaxID=2893752 RepID=A0A9Q3UTW1_9FLAO|nr:SNF2-related protein [Chryseobacterium muglaense]MCC9033284.1 SNF2-related protein [Chryseobacterium muglaense]MCM2553779.1 SNF2-related protein [Chryseobacterium muglaense]
MTFSKKKFFTKYIFNIELYVLLIFRIMGEINSKDIVQFIKNNARSESISKSFSVYPVLKNITSSSAVYECKGTANKPYKITIFYDKQINVLCTCPYDYAGICKHSIASLENFALTLKTNISIDENSKMNNPGKISKVKSNEIFTNIISCPLNKNGVDVEMILKDLSKGKNNYLSNPNLIIDSVRPEEIKTKFSDWSSSSSQTFTIDFAKSVLKIKCSCLEKTFDSYCKHLPIAFQKVINVLGAEYFTPNYLENKKASFLKDYGLNIEDDYKKFFQFSLDEKGFHAVSNFLDLQKISRPFESELSSELKRNTQKNTLKKKSNDYGQGLVFDFSDDSFLNFTPVEAKLNKEGTDLATHFKEIIMYRIESTLHQYDEKTTGIILWALKVNSLLEHFHRKSSAERLQDLVNAFVKLNQQIYSFPIFSHDVDDSYTRKNLKSLIIKDELPQLIFNFSEDLLFYNLQPNLKIGDQLYKLNSDEITITPLFIKKGQDIYPIQSAVLAADLLFYSEMNETKYIKKNALYFKENILTPLSAKYSMSTNNFVKTKERSKKSSIENGVNYTKQVYIEDSDDAVTFKLAIQYPEKLIDIDSNEIRIDVNDKGKFSYLERNTEIEHDFRELFREYHPDFQSQEDAFYLKPMQLIEDFWLLDVAEKMKNSSIELLGLKNLSSFKYNLNKPLISVSVQSDLDWFDVKIDVSFGNQKLSLKDLQKAFVKKSNFVTLSDGSIGILPEEWMRKFEAYFKVGEIKKEKLQISNFQFGIIDELYQELEEKPDFLIQLYEKKKRIQNISNIQSVEVPKGINANLRDYQRDGLNWLVFLDENQLGGCLADDMGLGKTLQTIAFLQYIKDTKKPDLPSLIIAPTSLIFNWENEIKNFCPTLKLLIYTGSNRNENLELFSQFDVVITTYGSLLNDIEVLKDKKFNYLILDESQAIKNPNSKRYKSVRLLNSYNRIALSGTPIENNTFDLYAQFNFLNPGILGNMTHFKKEFSDAIDKEKEVATSELLAKIIHPFILRRTKEQVAKELPDKIESILYCEMESEQRKVYDTFKNQYRDYLLNKIDENGLAKSQMYVLEGLMKLRQICNSPAIISEQEDYGNSSVKLDLLIENIKEKTGNHKILVFSSFVKMLQLIKNKLEEEQIPYEYLDGQTRDRQSRVENFQNEKEVRVFLISTKAGGIGLNLTEADYVFIVDPWWNPAVENQAIDRCYRIGQKKQVMAYRMICKDTIEEKILTLQNKKKGIAASIISVDEEQKSFNTEEIKDLFA